MEKECPGFEVPGEIYFSPTVRTLITCDPMTVRVGYFMGSLLSIDASASGLKSIPNSFQPPANPAEALFYFVILPHPRAVRINFDFVQDLLFRDPKLVY